MGAKNLIPEVCKLLGVEVGEEFKITSEGVTNNFKFEKKQLSYKDDAGNWKFAPNLLCALLCGDYKITKLPWKPKNKEDFYTFMYIFAKKITVTDDKWLGSIGDFARLRAGWVYRTREEAETALPKVAEELGVDYEL